MKTIQEMNKIELRAACKAAGVVGYGSLANDGMRALLVAKQQADMDAKAAAEAAAHAAAFPVVNAVDTNRTVQKNRPTQFGVTRPSNGTICADIWAALDKILSTGVHPTTKDLATLRDQNGWQKHTASTQFQRFRQFNGIMPRSTAGQEE